MTANAPETDEMPVLWTPKQIGEYLGVSTDWARRRLRTGEIPALKIGRVYRVVRSELRAWLFAQRVVMAGGDAAGRTLSYEQRSAAARDNAPETVKTPQPARTKRTPSPTDAGGVLAHAPIHAPKTKPEPES